MGRKMLVLAKADQLSIAHIQQLHDLYPEDTIKFLRSDSFAEHLSKFVVNRLHPQRITLVGAADRDYFGDPDNQAFSPSQLADYLIETCHLPKSVTVIDLIGMSPHFLQGGADFAEEFAKQLALRGYDQIEVKALTNLDHKKVLDTSFQIDTASKKYEISGVENTNRNRLKLRQIEKELATLDGDIEFIQHEIHKNICGLNLVNKKINETSKHTLQEKQKHYVERVDELTSRLNQLLNQRDPLIKEKHELYQQVKVLTTHDIKKTLDKEAQFYFNGKVLLQIDEVTKEIATKSQQGRKNNQGEMLRLEKNLLFLHKKLDFIVTLNTHISEIESSIHGFRLFSNVTSKQEKQKELQEFKAELINATDLTTAINLINDKLKDTKMLKTSVTKNVLENMLHTLTELNAYKLEEPLERVIPAGKEL